MRRLLFALWCALLACPALTWAQKPATAPAPTAPARLPQPWKGQCVGVTDGRTLRVLRDLSPERTRLHGIDAPENGQPFGAKAKQYLSRLVFGKPVRVEPVDRDRYGRLVARVQVNGRDVSEAVVYAGLAWAYVE